MNKKTYSYQVGNIIFDNYEELTKVFDVHFRVRDKSLKEQEVLVYDGSMIIGYKSSPLHFLLREDDTPLRA